MCLSSAEMIRLVSGNIGSDAARVAREHVSACGRCQKKWNDIVAVWNGLGDWEIEDRSTDLASAVLAEAASRPTTSRGWLRVAAVVLAAAGAGLAAGITVPIEKKQMTAAIVTPEDEAAALGVDALADGGVSLDQILDSDAEAM